MNLVSSHNETTTNFEYLIETLKDASLTRNFKLFVNYLEPFFEYDLERLPLYEKAFIQYFLGYYFVHFGKSANLTDYQEKGRDHLTNAIDGFRQLQFEDEAIEAEITLGWSYYQTGVIDNYEAFLLDALSRCHSIQSTAYFSVQVSLLILYYKQSDLAAAFRVIDSIKHRIEYCSDNRVKCQFYTNAGLIYRAAGQHQKAIEFYHHSISLSRKINNKQFEGLTLNCLAYCYSAINLFDLALESAEGSLHIFKKLNDDGFTADTLDTKATILLRLERFEEAWSTINNALFYFRKGESYLGWVEALWNKIEILYKLRKKSEIFETFRELSNVCQNLGLEKQQEFYRKFEELIIIPFGNNYDEKISTCEVSIVSPVLSESKGIVAAARKLGITHHQNLSNLLKKYPDLKNNLKSRDRRPRADRDEIKRIQVSANIIYPEIFDIKQTAFYRCSKRISELYFGQPFETILMVTQKSSTKAGELILMDQYFPFITEIVFEDNKYFFIEESGRTADPSARILGRIIGRTNSDNLKQHSIVFSKL